MCKYTYSHNRIFAHSQTHTHTHSHIHTFPHMFTHARIHICTHSHTHTHTFTHSQTHTFIHTHIHTFGRSKLPVAHVSSSLEQGLATPSAADGCDALPGVGSITAFAWVACCASWTSIGLIDHMFAVSERIRDVLNC